MKQCKAKQDGKPCRNQVDEGQEYCPYHLASQDANLKKKISIGGLVVTGLGIAVTILVKVGKFILTKKI